MTRLVVKDIIHIEKQIQAYEGIFRAQTGQTMAEIAKLAAELEKPEKDRKTAVVTITQGQGVIPGFAESLRAILRYSGIQADVMPRTDIGGMQDAFYGGYEILFAADDDVYSAFSLHGEKAFSDNGEATGRGFAAALAQAMKTRGISPDQKVLILGAGPVGRSAAAYILEQGGKPYFCDTDPAREEAAVHSLPGTAGLGGETDKKEFQYMIDATTAGNIITAADVTADTIIAAPGMPLGVTGEACSIATVIHNPLELGTLTMYYSVLKQVQTVRTAEQK